MSALMSKKASTYIYSRHSNKYKFQPQQINIQTHIHKGDQKSSLGFIGQPYKG